MPCLASSIVLSLMLNCPPFWRCTWTQRNILSRLTKYGKRKRLKVVSTDYLNVNRPTRSPMDTTTSRQHAKNTDLIQYWTVRRAHIYQPKEKRRLTCILCALSVWCGRQFTRKRGRWSACEHKHTQKQETSRRYLCPKDVFLRSYIASRCHPLQSFVKSTSQSSIAWIRLNVDSVKAELQVCVNFTIPCTSMSQKFLGNKKRKSSMQSAAEAEKAEVLQADSHFRLVL